MRPSRGGGVALPDWRYLKLPYTHGPPVRYADGPTADPASPYASPTVMRAQCPCCGRLLTNGRFPPEHIDARRDDRWCSTCRWLLLAEGLADLSWEWECPTHGLLPQPDVWILPDEADIDFVVDWA